MNKGMIILLLIITYFSTVLVLSVTEDQNTAIEGDREGGKRGGEVVNFVSLLICFSFECGIGTER